MTDAITIKNVHKLDISEVVGSMYAMIGVVECWDNLSISPIEEVLKERVK